MYNKYMLYYICYNIYIIHKYISIFIYIYIYNINIYLTDTTDYRQRTTKM